ncbi:MAG: hypothetical protein AAFY11_14950, partial [Cyanobacteria bacterium J06641_5]
MTDRQVPKSGKYIVQFADGSLEEGLRILKQVTHLNEGVRMARGLGNSLPDGEINEKNITVLQELESAIIEQEIS